MDFQRMLSRATLVVTLSISAVAPLILWLTVHHDVAGQPVPTGLLVGVAVFVAAGSLVYLARVWAEPRVPFLVRHRLGLDVTQLAVFEALTIVSGAALGGLVSMQWAYSFLLVMFAAVQLPYWGALAFGVVVDIGVVAAAVLSTTPVGDQLGGMVLALVTLPMFTYFVATVTRGLFRLQAATAAEHDLLATEVERLSAALDDVARGDLRLADGAVRPGDAAGPGGAGGDDVDPAAAAVGAVWASLGTSLGSVRALVDDVGGAGRALNQALAELEAQVSQSAAGYAEQSAAIAETSASVRQLAATATQIAATVGTVSQAADEVSGRADQARADVGQSVDQLQSIVAGVDDIARQADGLEASSTEIERIVAVIDELADRTNLLALNAAIEAARAGEHGRGFAVVASEVRALAERSQQSAAQIQQIVARIRADTQGTVTATRDGRVAAQRGVDLAEHVRASLDAMVTAARRAAGAVDQIEAAAAQQTTASDQVASAMGQVAAVAEQQAAGTRSSAEAVAGLNDLSHQLHEALTAFRT